MILKQSGQASRRADRSKNLVGFTVGGVRYAVSIFEVREIINPIPIVVLPHAPKVVLGVSDHRGVVVPVIDMRLRLGLPTAERTRRTKWIIVENGKRAVGLVVDSVTDVFGTATSEERTVPELGLGDDLRGIDRVYNHGGHLVFVIDVPAVVAPARGLDMEGIELAALQRSSPPVLPPSDVPSAMPRRDDAAHAPGSSAAPRGRKRRA